MPEVVDLRSDTVTRPTEGMRRAMATAEVGDDVLEGDPTTGRLEERVAELLEKERALFFPSGIMANQTALAVLGRPGGEVLLEADAHIFHYEEGAPAVLSGLQLRPIPTADGLLTPELVAEAIRPASPFILRTSVLALENTHLASGGRVVSVESTRALAGAARAHGLPVHLDGARLWHASVEVERPPGDWAREADTVMVAFSKGLGAPVGSVLAGSEEVMAEAWRVRRRFGGGMRQSGILAAAALHALDHHLDRLGEDHALARELASRLDTVPGLSTPSPETNIVMVDVAAEGPDLTKLLNFLKEDGILMVQFGPRRLRAVTHMDVDRAGIRRTCAVFEKIMTRHGEADDLA